MPCAADPTSVEQFHGISARRLFLSIRVDNPGAGCYRISAITNLASIAKGSKNSKMLSHTQLS